MESEVTLKAKAQIEKTKIKLEQIRQAEIKVTQGSTGADERLESMKSGLPALLAARALGQATDGEVASLKRDIWDLEASIEETRLTLKGLKAMEPPLENSMRMPRRILRKAEKYRLVRSDLKNEKPDYTIEELRLLSVQLGLESDYESFVEEHPRLV